MLDTLRIADMLRDAGFDERQARALADVQKQSVEEGGLAAKSDVVRLEGRVESTRARLIALETPIKIMFGALIALILPIFVKAFFG